MSYHVILIRLKNGLEGTRALYLTTYGVRLAYPYSPYPFRYGSERERTRRFPLFLKLASFCWKFTIIQTKQKIEKNLSLRLAKNQKDHITF